MALYFCHVKAAVPNPMPGKHLLMVVLHVDRVPNIGVVLVVNVGVVVRPSLSFFFFFLSFRASLYFSILSVLVSRMTVIREGVC